MNRSDNFRSSQSRRLIDNPRRSLDGQLPILSRDGMIDPKRKSDQFYRRHRSGSDKDSAYSEGSMNDRDRSLPTKIRRTASMRDANRARQSVKTSRHHAGERRMHHSADRRPRQLSAAELMNDEHRQRKSVPNWLKAALDDDEPDIPRISSTMPAARRKNEFPLLHTSDEESVAYPSVSQTLGNQREPKWGHGGRAYRENHQHMRRGINHGRHNAAYGQHGRGGKRPHAHGHRMLHNHGKRHGHGQGQNRGHHRRGDRQGRMGPGHQRTRQHPSHGRVRPQDDAFLRKMMENDQLVDRKAPNTRPGEQRAPRQRLHETPSSLHFPERSRWDDHEMEMPERGVTKAMIENYLESA